MSPPDNPILSTLSAQPDRDGRIGQISPNVLANWAELPPDLLQLITRRLSLVDYLSFGAVCTSWRCVATKENYNPKNGPPWSMVVVGDTTEFFPFSGSERACCNHNHKLHTVQDHLAPYFSRGWLMECRIDGEVRLFNPLTLLTIKLPSMELQNCYYIFVEQFALSASPSQSAAYSVMISCEVARTLERWEAILAGGWTGQRRKEQQTWIWRSEQRVWTRVGVPTALTIERLVHYRGQFVALDRQLHMLTLDEDDVTKENFTVRFQIDKELFTGIDLPYLVECSGSLLMIDKESRKGKACRVVAVDLERRNWREVKSLENATIFLNDVNPISMDTNGESTVKSNCIYFIKNEYVKGAVCVGIYHMEGGYIERKLFELPATEYAWIQPCF